MKEHPMGWRHFCTDWLPIIWFFSGTLWCLIIPLAIAEWFGKETIGFVLAIPVAVILVYFWLYILISLCKS